MEDYKNLKVWELSHKFALDIYEITSKYPEEESWNLVTQMRTSASSVPSKIAEGCAYTTAQDFARFLQIALGSVNKIEYQIILSADLGYITNEKKAELEQKIRTIKQLLTVLIEKLE